MAAISSSFDNINFSLNWNQVVMEKTEEEEEEEDKYVMGLQKKKKKQAKDESNG